MINFFVSTLVAGFFACFFMAAGLVQAQSIQSSQSSEPPIESRQEPTPGDTNVPKLDVELIRLSYEMANRPTQLLPALDQTKVDKQLIGKASWYGKRFHKKRTASGETFDENKLTAAHRKLPLGTYVRVQSLDTGREVILKINDRGPYRSGRIIDLSKKARDELALDPGKGLYLVKITLL